MMFRHHNPKSIRWLWFCIIVGAALVAAGQRGHF